MQKLHRRTSSTLKTVSERWLKIIKRINQTCKRILKSRHKILQHISSLSRQLLPFISAESSPCFTLQYLLISSIFPCFMGYCSLWEMLALQPSHNSHSHMCGTYMYGTHTHVSRGCVGVGWWLYVYHLPFSLHLYILKNDRNISLLQQVYNSPLTWGGPHTLWSPPHVRGLLYTYCKSVVRESVLLYIILLVTEECIENQ